MSVTWKSASLRMVNEKIEQLIKANADQIKSEVLAVDVKFDEANGYVKDWSINGENVTMGVERA